VTVATDPHGRLGSMPAGPLVRTLNIHNTPRRRAAELERVLVAAAAGWVDADEAEIVAVLAGRLRPRAPVVLPLLFEAYRNHYDVALPLLERAGLRGWFFVPTGFVDAPAAEQRAFAARHQLYPSEDEHGDGRVAMSWDELREVAARGHVIACHTETHCGVADLDTPARSHAELVASRARLEDELGREVRTLAWLWGSAFGEDARADAAMRDAGYALVVSATRIQRIA
jgi:peptidoglycan/xylan/chitin deacetylase (PgdA/CDA1 family)